MSDVTATFSATMYMDSSCTELYTPSETLYGYPMQAFTQFGLSSYTATFDATVSSFNTALNGECFSLSSGTSTSYTTQTGTDSGTSTNTYTYEAYGIIRECVNDDTMAMELYEDADCSSQIEGAAFRLTVGVCEDNFGSGWLATEITGCDLPSAPAFDGAAEMGTTLALFAGAATLGAM